MEITYLGHSAFKLKGKDGTVVIDPYADEVGLKFPSVSADIIVMSHDHPDHNAAHKVKGTARRPEPFLIAHPGEYEVGGVSVFGTATYHDSERGAKRGTNTVFTVLIDDVRVCHLGDLGHELTNEQVSAIGTMDVLLCPVGGEFTINPKQAVAVIQQLEPTYVIPMHFKSEKHTAKMFEPLKTLEDFLKEYGMSPAPQPKLVVEKNKMPEEETILVVLSEQAAEK